MSESLAAAYARAATDAPASIANQMEAIRRSTEEHGETLAREYEDAGYGGETDQRPQFQQMIADATSPDRPFTTIIVYDLSRFIRSNADLAEYRQQLSDAGVELRSVSEPESTRHQPPEVGIPEGCRTRMSILAHWKHHRTEQGRTGQDTRQESLKGFLSRPALQPGGSSRTNREERPVRQEPKQHTTHSTRQPRKAPEIGSWAHIAAQRNSSWVHNRPTPQHARRAT